MLTSLWDVRKTLSEELMISMRQHETKGDQTYVWMTSAAKENMKLESPAGCLTN